MVVIPVPVSESLPYRNVKQCFADDFYGNMGTKRPCSPTEVALDRRQEKPVCESLF